MAIRCNRSLPSAVTTNSRRRALETHRSPTCTAAATASIQPANRLQLVGKAHAIVREHHAVAFLRGIQVHIGGDDEIVIACVHARTYATREEAALDLFEYIEVVHNRARIHSVLGYLSPAEFEEANWPKENSRSKAA